MSGSRRSILPAPLQAALAQIAAEMARKALGAGTVERALGEIDGLPPASVARADGEIADLARLDRRPDFDSSGNRIYFPTGPGTVPQVEGAEYLFLFHRNGFLREPALNRLTGGLRSPFFFAAVAYRLNDWVGPVRRAAEACARRCFPLTDAAIVAEAAFFLFNRRQVWLRWDEEAEALELALDRPDVCELVARRLAEATSGPMSTVLRGLLRRPRLDAWLPALASSSVLPTVRAVALRAMIEGRAAWPAGFERQWVDKSHGLSRLVTAFAERPVAREAPVEALIEQGARDRSALVRRVAADGLVRHRGALAGLDGLMALLAEDPNPAVRARIDFLRREAAPSAPDSR